MYRPYSKGYTPEVCLYARNGFHTFETLSSKERFWLRLGKMLGMVGKYSCLDCGVKLPYELVQRYKETFPRHFSR